MEYKDKKRHHVIATAGLILTRKNKNNENEFLLQLRSNTGYMDNKYDTASNGHLDEAESLLDATCREAKEELNITIDKNDLKFVGVIHDYKENYINFFFTASKYIGTPIVNETNKCKELLWTTKENLPDNTVPKIKEIITNFDLNKAIFLDNISNTFAL